MLSNIPPLVFLRKIDRTIINHWTIDRIDKKGKFDWKDDGQRRCRVVAWGNNGGASPRAGN